MSKSLTVHKKDGLFGHVCRVVRDPFELPHSAE